jgi:uncharacterized protein (TIGR03085 family)
VSYSRQERLALCDLLDETGPDAATLCAGWTTADLAAHLVLREHRLDAAAGVLGGPLAAHTARVQRRIRERSSFPELVRVIRSGPPRLSLLGIPGVDARVNTVEYFVHHEDIRRAIPGWEPRELTSGESDTLWGELRMARRMLRKAPVGVELARDDADQGKPLGSDVLRITAKNATPVVTVIGPPAELLLWALGRTTVADVRFDGTEAAVSRLTAGRWGPGAKATARSPSRA